MADAWVWFRRRAVGKIVGVSLAAGVCAVVLFFPGGLVVRAEEQAKAPISGTAAVCAGCHPEAAQSWANSLHRRTVGAPQLKSEWQGCAACHRGASEHLADVTDVSKRPTLANLTPDQITDLCQTCHRGGKQALWMLSPHSRTKEACLTCHDPHGVNPDHMLKAPEVELCRQCHPTQVAEGNLPSHHPIQEGKMTCSDCHNVHGEERGTLPEATNGEMCYRCHADKQGPFIAEHPPVTEDCTICHRPHGSPVDNLLVEDMPMLCLQCHSGHGSNHRDALVPVTTDPAGVANGLQAIGAFYTRCTSCHSRIHGTDLLSQRGEPVFMPGTPLAPLGSEEIGTAMKAAALDQSLWGFSYVDVGRFDQDNNPQFVREWDGKDYNVPTSRLSIVKYGQQDDLRFEATDLPRGDQEIRLRFGSPRYDVQIRQSGLTHRLGRFDENVDVMVPAFPSHGSSTYQVNTTDLTDGENDFRINRTLVDARLAARCPRLPYAKLLLNYWQAAETGTRQFLFVSHCTACHKIQTAEPIDRITTITEGGAQLDFPKASLRYLRGHEEFSNRAPESYFTFAGAGPVFAGTAPLFGVASTRADTNDLRGSAAIGDRVSVAALWRTRDRRDLLGNGTINISSAGGGATYALSPHLRLQTSAFRRRLNTSPLLEEGIARDRDTTRADLRFTGLPHTIVNVGYEVEAVRRADERALVPDRSDSSIWSSSLLFRPLSRLSLQVRYRNTKTDQRDFFDPTAPPAQFGARLLGLPTDGTLLSAVLSYSLRSNTMLSGMYNRQRDIFEETAPELGIFNQVEQETRSWGSQLVHNRGRSQLSAGYYRQDGSNLTNAIYGKDTFTLAPPLVESSVDFPPIDSHVAYDYRATIETLDGSTWLTSRVRLFGRYARTQTDGRERLNDLGDYLDQNPDLNGVAVILNPFDIEILDRWCGVGYAVDRDTEVVLSQQRRSWDDAANPSHDGAYTLWRLGLRKQF